MDSTIEGHIKEAIVSLNKTNLVYEIVIEGPGGAPITYYNDPKMKFLLVQERGE